MTDAKPFVVERPGIYTGVPDDVIRIPAGAHIAVIDAADHHLVQGYRWHALPGHAGKVYAHARVGNRSIYMHRLIAGTPAGMETDHVNGDGLDNRRANLRPATPSQNRANIGKPRRPDGTASSSRFKGVSWDRSRGKWQAKITVAGVCRSLGRYGTEADAARAYDAAATQAWPGFALLNFPTEAAA